MLWHMKNMSMIIAGFTGSLLIFRCAIVCNNISLWTWDYARPSFQFIVLEEDMEIRNILMNPISHLSFLKFVSKNMNEKYIFVLFLHS